MERPQQYAITDELISLQVKLIEIQEQLRVITGNAEQVESHLRRTGRIKAAAPVGAGASGGEMEKDKEIIA